MHIFQGNICNSLAIFAKYHYNAHLDYEMMQIRKCENDYIIFNNNMISLKFITI